MTKTEHGRKDRPAGLMRRSIYDARELLELPGKLVRREGQRPTADAAVNEAYDGLGIAHGFFWDVFRRDSIDGKGMPLKATVHYGKDFCNAVWNGKIMILGDGDKLIFHRFTKAVDIIVYEFSKGIVQLETQLENWGQAGALTTSISDIFSALAKQWRKRQDVHQADWLVASGLFRSGVKASGIRSIKDPGTAYDDPKLGTDPQPAHMRDYVKTNEDNAGVHINSGIPNRAFYHIAMTIGGHAWEDAGRIWYDSFFDKRLEAKSEFRDFARLTLANASRLYGSDSTQARAVKEGWEEVGVKIARG